MFETLDTMVNMKDVYTKYEIFFKKYRHRNDYEKTVFMKRGF